jgi:hypothetical protein
MTVQLVRRACTEPRGLARVWQIARERNRYANLRDLPTDDSPGLTTSSTQRVSSRVASEAPSSSRAARQSLGKVNSMSSRTYPYTAIATSHEDARNMRR